MTFDAIMSDLKQGIYKPIYFLMGEESYFIDKITNYIVENLLTEAEKSFNQTILYGKDTDAGTVDNMARRFPMMAKYQLVVVREAQSMKKIDDLMFYAQKPSPSTILVINYKYGSIPKNRKLYKALDKTSVVFESKKLYENQVPAWIKQYLKDRKYTASPESLVILTDYLGTDLAKLANELNKLTITLPEGTEILPNHIEENIGISKDFNNFELQKALMERNVLKANRIINYFGENQKDNPIVVTITSLYFFFSKVLAYQFLKDKSPSNAASVLKVNPYFLKDYQLAARNYNYKQMLNIISVLREYDVKSKGVDNASSTPGDLLKEMVFKILH